MILRGRSPRSFALLAVVGASVALLLGGTALARSSSVLPYPPAEVWPTAIRYLRVDRGATLRERDAESGYVLFDLAEGNKVYKGSLELIRTSDSEGREATRVVASLPDLPRHFETTLLDKLALKVRDEYGSPAPAPPPPAPGEEGKKKRPPDAGSPPRAPQGDLPRPEQRDGQPSSSRVAPSSTAWPGATAMRVTRPSEGDSTGISIFMDSRITTVCPVVTESPMATSTFQTVPAM
jgi:hypothetical protein